MVFDHDFSSHQIFFDDFGKIIQAKPWNVQTSHLFCSFISLLIGEKLQNFVHVFFFFPFFQSSHIVPLCQINMPVLYFFACNSISMFCKGSVTFMALNASRSITSSPSSMQRSFTLSCLDRLHEMHFPPTFSDYLNFNLNGQIMRITCKTRSISSEKKKKWEWTTWLELLCGAWQFALPVDPWQYVICKWLSGSRPQEHATPAALRVNPTWRVAAR